MKKIFLASLLVASALLAACGSSTEDESANSSVSEGERLVYKNCSTCHGGNLEGMGNVPSLADVGSRLTEDEILHVIENGTDRGMPDGILKGEDAKEAAKWLSEQK